MTRSPHCSPTVLALALACSIGCGRPPAPSQAPLTAAFDPNRPDQCAACHQAVVAEWETSLHRRAHTSRDPIYAAVAKVRSAREGPDLVAAHCANCHSPAGTTEALADLGVTCSTCHQTQAIDRSDGKLGLAALTRTPPAAIAGPHGAAIAEGAPHTLALADPAVFDGSSLCLACHDELKNADGIAACSTGLEWRAGEDRQTCVDCHMPWVDGPSGVMSPTRTRHRSHAFIGPHHALRDPTSDLARDAVLLSVALGADAAAVTLDNRTQHAWPTGFPGRFAVVSLVGFDATGQAIWRNFTEDPMREHPDAVLNKVYLDADGSPTLAPYAKTLARDTRLKTGERRTFSIALPPPVTAVEARLLSRLVAPPLARMLALGDLPELAPRVIATARAQR